MEIMHYHVAPAERAAFLAPMQEVRQVRGRAGAVFWQLYEDVAHPEGWLEVWSMESWTDHLREVGRLSDADRAVLARACAFQSDPATRPPARYLAVDPDARPRPRRNAITSGVSRSPPPIRPPRWAGHDGLETAPGPAQETTCRGTWKARRGSSNRTRGRRANDEQRGGGITVLLYMAPSRDIAFISPRA